MSYTRVHRHPSPPSQEQVDCLSSSLAPGADSAQQDENDRCGDEHAIARRPSVLNNLVGGSERCIHADPRDARSSLGSRSSG